MGIASTRLSHRAPLFLGNSSGNAHGTQVCMQLLGHTDTCACCYTVYEALLYGVATGRPTVGSATA
jgi:hypothetical protein